MDYLGDPSIDGKITLKFMLKTGYDNEQWIHLLEDTDQWPVPYKERIFLTTSTNTNFSRITLLHGFGWLVSRSGARNVQERAPAPTDPLSSRTAL
jgi:hypothetical protein